MAKRGSHAWHLLSGGQCLRAGNCCMALPIFVNSQQLAVCLFVTAYCKQSTYLHLSSPFPVTPILFPHCITVLPATTRFSLIVVKTIEGISWIFGEKLASLIYSKE
eukprot:TRINITY_DN80851_c0_g1_i1.p1 TRINITY_DN80851_c0_g1~~TRINITY_DN80851_c0_g1_i1.p1  ORF type:complete len:115 (-),score=3.57 TRINITY_DN80851_c0_g1_i1:112-429(-)